MNIYMDVSCLNRPFDDQRQARIRLEAEAVTVILQQLDAGRWRQISSEMAEIEIAAVTDSERRRRIAALLPVPHDRMRLSASMFRRAAKPGRLGFKPADALHVAAAEAGGADVLLTCDDRLCRLAARRAARLSVRLANPLTWLKEQADASNPG